MCQEIPLEGRVLLANVPPNYCARKMLNIVEEAKAGARERLVVMGALSTGGAFWGPFGVLVGSLLGLSVALDDRSGQLSWSQQLRISKLDQTLIQQWLEKPGAPWTRNLPGDGWLDRRYRTSEFLPIYECERNAQGEPVRIAFRFREACFEHYVGTGVVVAQGPQGKAVTFDAHLSDSSSDGVRMELPDQAALFFELNGQAFYLPHDPWEWAGGPDGPVCKYPLLPNQRKFDCPFPEEWVSASLDCLEDHAGAQHVAEANHKIGE